MVLLGHHQALDDGGRLGGADAANGQLPSHGLEQGLGDLALHQEKKGEERAPAGSGGEQLLFGLLGRSGREPGGGTPTSCWEPGGRQRGGPLCALAFARMDCPAQPTVVPFCGAAAGTRECWEEERSWVEKALSNRDGCATRGRWGGGEGGSHASACSAGAAGQL